MTLFQAWQTALLASWVQVSTTLLSFIPNFIGAVVVFLIGLLIAMWGKKLVEELLRAIRLEEGASRSGFTAWLRKADIKLSATELVGEVVRWVLLLVFFVAAVDILGLKVVSGVLGQVLAYIPNVMAAALVLGAGFLIANFVDSLVRGAFATIDHDAARTVGRLARWVVLIVAFFAAVGQLQIAPRLVDTFFQGLTWTLVLAVGLSVGLGAKDLVSKVLEDWYKRLHR
ncbi:MAG: hypothetical protein A3H88_00495 [Candidatus Blackburnbacteria bacterium RIFCSPLOWO2_02_FULL_44_9]|uniref:Small-conductance mechanosensitive ion channel n=1 Tax=Candidatus Blackburnbacteria bacterium RIFCSPHIGHO2_02_FULL_44_20 TaxID=1797516 RepID=A0A1G1VA74_9BACT|nr:MAG: hypothetical protein A3E16_03040 [Candidatus Blackburnbacteria bacterium RIFCSPHIGHO2_12_FULL_44_25]OGY12350.1 MAG: hypothetical protein A3D26_01850 [Candidatus Blackburnbacteria bacterium RIFCSPHIGHO2_02_FULL_44_20]OGY15993.1 MAG: hypothetical protein A3H88_00495 [Candidatus Blackburnbacteria bacterium RIFCSPLOWO2_02_FULL_44_9]